MENYIIFPDILSLIIMISIITLGGIIRGFIGFGPALITIPIFAYLYSPAEALVLQVIMEIPSTLYLTRLAVKTCNFKTVLPTFISMIFFIPVGMFLVVSMNPTLMRVFISIVVIVLVIILAMNLKLEKLINQKIMISSGALGGFLQGLAGMGGPPIVTILVARNDSDNETRGNILFLMSGIVVFSILSQFFYDLIRLDLVLVSILLSPIYMIATFMGSKYYNYNGKKIFKKAVLFLLALISISTLVASLQ